MALICCVCGVIGVGWVVRMGLLVAGTAACWLLAARFSSTLLCRAYLQAMALHGRKWSEVARLVPGRTDVQCRERFMNVLNPGGWVACLRTSTLR